MTSIDLKLERRKRFLETLIKEAVINVLAEQQPPEAPPAPAPAETPPAEPQAATQAPEGPQSPEQFTVDDMIERLNVVRGGRSFTDPEVYGQLVTWFKRLNEDQKVVLQNFLVDLGKIVINVQENEQEAPEQPPAPSPAQPMPPSAPPAPPAVAPPAAPGPVA